MLLIYLGLALVALCYLLHNRCMPRSEPNEPPIVSSRIPFVGHIIGLWIHGSRYYQHVSAKCKLPVFTLPMLNGKVYVVTSADLVSAVNRNAKVLAFNPFIAQLGKRITGHDDATSQIVQHNLNGENGPGYVTDIHDGSITSLAPGKDLECLTGAAITEASAYMNNLKHGDVIHLFAWTKQVLTVCSTRAIYGPGNPFSQADGELIKSFWDFDHDLNLLIVDLIPRILAPRGHLGRSKLGLAFQQYFERFDPSHADSAALIVMRHSTNTRYGLTPWNQGRLEVGVLLGILANTVPAIFYMILHVLSNPTLLRDIRDEIANTSLRYHDKDTRRNPSLAVLTIREKCTLLHSTFQEVLRFHALGSSVRYVREDILLQDRYLLKKGMVVQMPMAVMHADPSAWGPDVHDFQPRRFMKPTNKFTAASPGATPPSDGNSNARSSLGSYRPFGGGASLCPGRHFVTLEAMAMTALFVMRFDAIPTSPDGRWSIPNQRQESMATNVFPPEQDVQIEIREREDWKGARMGFEMA